MNAQLHIFKSSKRIAIFALILSVIFSMNPISAFAEVVRKNYIVSVVPDTQALVRESIAKLGETPHDELSESMDGFFISMTDLEAAALRLDPNVLQIVEDQPMQLLDVQSPTPSWGLDRIDQDTTSYDSQYNYPASAGQGVRAYVVDTGVMATNPDFAGRILPGYDALGQGLEAADCQGHGTHVAGTIAGTKFGVAKNASIVPVRVLGCTGTGSWSGFIAGIDWIIKNHPAGTPGVMSASIGGSLSTLVNAAIERLYQAGITPVIAAGNSNADACGYSPAASPNAITVGASDSNDARASFSNYGDCVDVFAPGVSIVSDSNTDLAGSAVKSGTSMATPHVSGLAALYLAANPTATPADVTSSIRAGAIAGIVSNALSLNGNYLINNNFVKASLPVPVPSPDTPTNLAVSSITTTGAVVSWSAAVTGAAATSYLVEYKVAGSATWSAISEVATTSALTGLTANTSYSIRVSAINGSLTSVPSAELMFSTAPDLPGAVRNFRKIYDYGNKVLFAWDAPATLGGASTVNYKSEELVNGSWVLRTASTPSANILVYTTPQTSYTWRITALNVSGAGPATEYTFTSNSLAPGSVTSLTVGAISSNSAVASWAAVTQVGANPIQYSVQIYSGSVYMLWKTETVAATSFNLTGLSRKTNYGVRVTAYSDGIAGPVSLMSKFVTLAKAATSPTSTKVALSATTATLSWMSPADAGGEVVTGYVVEKLNVDGTWSSLANLPASATAFTVDKPARATTQAFRVAAVTAFGIGDWATINVIVAADKPGAPQSVTSVASGINQLALSWAAPTDNGGAAITSYQVQRSLNNGLTWTAYLNTVTAAALVPIAAKGTTVLYSVVALNSSGYGERSIVVSSSTAATVPAAPTSVRTIWNTNGTLNVNWYLPSDNGGSVLTAIRVEQSINGSAFVALPDLAATATSLTLPRLAPGTKLAFRVFAINSLGVSVSSNLANVMVPFLKPGTPANLAIADSAAGAVLSWVAPTELGGSAVTGYVVQYSANSINWYSRTFSNVTTAVLPKAAKGATFQYRVAAVTGYGLSDFTAPISFATPTTVPAAPIGLRASLTADSKIAISFIAPTDNGGLAITGYRIEKSINGVWSTAATSTTGALAITKEAPGLVVGIRAFAINANGESVASNVWLIQMPIVAASAPTSLTAVVSGNLVDLTWQAPANNGGAAVQRYLVQYSTNNGVNWIAAAYSNGPATSVRINAPPKGVTFSYRVMAYTPAGFSAPSSSAAATGALTVASSVQLTMLQRSTTGLVLGFRQPKDLGGYQSFEYRLQQQVNGAWNTIASGTGAANVTVNFAAPAKGVMSFYRVIAVNQSGESAPAQFSFRG